jgi:hypothetical protein
VKLSYEKVELKGHCSDKNYQNKSKGRSNDVNGILKSNFLVAHIGYQKQLKVALNKKSNYQVVDD